MTRQLAATASLLGRRPTPLWANLVRGLRQAGRSLVVWQGRAAARIHLADLDDRVLRDMGMTRADARREAAKPLWRK